MRVKIITYAKTKNKKVARKYVDLTPVNDFVYFNVEEQNEVDSANDVVAVYLKTRDIYHYFTIFDRKSLDTPEIVAVLSGIAVNFPEKIQQALIRGNELTNVAIEVCGELGIDTAPLYAYQVAYDAKHAEEERLNQEFRPVKRDTLKVIELYLSKENKDQE